MDGEEVAEEAEEVEEACVHPTGLVNTCLL